MFMGISMAAGLIFGIHSAQRATRLNPIVASRHEVKWDAELAFWKKRRIPLQIEGRADPCVHFGTFFVK